MKYEVLQNAYEGETRIIIGQDNYWVEVDNSFGLENLISHENNRSGILRTKLLSDFFSQKINGSRLKMVLYGKILRVLIKLPI